ncbi:TetR/AcrR family transcriptional regulator [Microbacterium lushaniae]|uniref:TetR family transcriptional regulator n=1 Tax=Microbacterium lushaniae TaxID=2614639 RepID=A0A5J6L2N9_9MICO|nr:TetR/AcrR family transcriptional regulator C-terminal domain-containing protein [Microbacterium lushaniae]QEW02784.1 TetR family transcriptional regulator [Microbacterium lushaniae]
MPRPLIDLLWRGHPNAPDGGSRGPRAKRSTSTVVDGAIALADASGLDAVTVRALAQSLGMSTMSVYTHVNSRDDLVVLMTDSAHTTMTPPPYRDMDWRSRVRAVADANLALHTRHPWLLDVHDPRSALGPGTIAKYDHELHAFDDTGIDGVQRDATLAFVLDFVKANASARLVVPEFGAIWSESADTLAHYVGQDFPLARRVGAAAGESMGGPYSPDAAWEFGLGRVIAGLAAIIDE